MAVPATLSLSLMTLTAVCVVTAWQRPASVYGGEDNGTRICQSVDIRNSVHNLKQLRGCRAVEGYVQIVLIDKANETDFDGYSFPELREITQYLLLYRVVGLRKLGHLFPNLTIIRGDTVFEDYGLVIYEMFHLQEVGLKSLTHIMRGAVRIEKNPSKSKNFLQRVFLFHNIVLFLFSFSICRWPSGHNTKWGGCKLFM